MARGIKKVQLISTEPKLLSQGNGKRLKGYDGMSKPAHIVKKKKYDTVDSLLADIKRMTQDKLACSPLSGSEN